MADNYHVDLELALKLAEHIDHPGIESATRQNIRRFYIEEAKILLEETQNPLVKELLEYKIQQYN